MPRTEAEEAIIAQAIEMLGCDRSAVVRSHCSPGPPCPRGLAWLMGRVSQIAVIDNIKIADKIPGPENVIDRLLTNG